MKLVQEWPWFPKSDAAGDGVSSDSRNRKAIPAPFSILNPFIPDPCLILDGFSVWSTKDRLTRKDRKRGMSAFLDSFHLPVARVVLPVDGYFEDLGAPNGSSKGTNGRGKLAIALSTLAVLMYAIGATTRFGIFLPCTNAMQACTAIWPSA